MDDFPTAVSFLRGASDRAADYVAGLRERPVAPSDAGHLPLPRPLPESPTSGYSALDDVFAELEPHTVASAGPRYFGFVIGGSHPAALAAEIVAAGWDQNVALAVMSPALATVESTAAAWLCDLLRLPAHVSCGFVTGGTMANWTALAAARHQVLADAGWDLARDGLFGAPQIRLVVGRERHATIDLAARYLGIGSSQVSEVSADAQGRMEPAALAAILRADQQPTIVCAQAGNVNSGAFDPIDEVCRLAGTHGAWVHVDAAVGAWLGAVPDRRHLVTGWEAADSWAFDAHKGLNTAYDSGVVMCAHPDAHSAACSVTAPYLQTTGGLREGSHWTPESSRRARALGIYAVLQTLGRAGVAEMVGRCCDLARQFADELSREPEVAVLNDVVANQVLVRFADSDDVTEAVTREVQAGGVCWMGATVWRGSVAMRISVSNWSTTERDVDLSVAEILRCLAHVRS